MIPANWQVVTFGKIYAEPSRNGIYKSSEYQGFGTRIVNMGEMFGFEFISDQDMSRISLTSKEMVTTALSDGDLLFGRRSVVPAGAGKCSLVVRPAETLTFESSIIRVRLDQSVAIPLFYYYFFASPAGRSVMGVIVSGTNVKGIRGSELRELNIPHPPTHEQRAIATALSDVDALLDSLARLIKKKRDLKQATMQQLLTGQTRLPGFGREWHVKRLGAIADVIDPHPSHRAPDVVANGVPFVGIGDLDENGNIVGNKLRLVDTSVLDEHAFRYNLDDELIGLGRVASIGKVVALKKHMDGYAISPTLGVIRGREAKRNYLLYALKSKFVTEQFTKIMSGSTRSSVGMEVLRELQIELPPTEEEQTAIAAVLSDMDSELSALEARLSKARALKQAMMSELLTGKTRLPTS